MLIQINLNINLFKASLKEINKN